MHKIEFETVLSGNMISIPSSFLPLNKKKAKIVIELSEDETSGNFNKESLLKAFKKAKDHKIFNDIDDSVQWQKELRNEWK